MHPVLLYALAVAPIHAEAPDLPQLSSPELTILSTGGSGGVSSGRYAWELLRSIGERPSLTIEEVRLIHGVAAQGPWTLIADDNYVQSLLTTLGHLTECSTVGAVMSPSGAHEALFFGTNPPPGWAMSLRSAQIHTELTVRRCPGATLYGPADGLPDATLGAWELRQGLRMSVKDGDGLSTPFTVVGKPTQEASRTHARALAFLEEHPDAIVLNAGNSLDGASSVVDGALSLHRPTGLRALSEVRPDALLPGQNELAAGPRAFIDEARPYSLPLVATNWSTSDPSLALPASVMVTRGAARSAVLGVLDPALMERLPSLAADGVTLTDPISALNAEISRLQALPEPPDAIVLLTTSGAAQQDQLRRKVRGADLLIGDTSFATLRVASETWVMRPTTRAEKGAPVTLPLDGLLSVSLIVDPDAHRVVEVKAEPLLVRGDAPVHPATTAAITAVRAELYPSLDHPLLPAPAEGPASAWGAANFGQLVCEAVREHSGADLVVLAPRPPPRVPPGPLTALAVADALASLERLEAHPVPADRYADLLNALPAVELVTCGSMPGAAFPLAGGRPLDPSRTYRLVTTDLTRQSTPLGALLQAGPPPRPLDPRGPQPLGVTLHAAVMDTLTEAVKRQGADAAMQHFLVERPHAIEPLWLLRARGLSLEMTRFDGVNDPAPFAAVPETLAVSPSSFTLSTAADLSLEYSSAAWAWDLRGRSAYSVVRTADAAQEASDDGRLSTSLVSRRLTLPYAPGAWAPYGELLYDSEWTPTDDGAGSLNPRQADLSMALGLGAAPAPTLRRLRLGGFANRDLNQLSDKPTEVGLRLDLEASRRLGDVARLSALGDVMWFAHTNNDDPSDLRLRAWGELRLSLPLARWLELSVYSQGFVVYGRHPENDVWGLASTTGATLTASGSATLGR